MVRLGLALCLLLLAGAAAGAGEALEEEDPAVVLRGSPQGWVARGNFPVFVDARTDRGADLVITLGGGRYEDYTATRAVSLPPGSAVRLERTAPTLHYRLRTTAANGNKEGSFSVGSRSLHSHYDGSAPTPLLCLNSFLLRELEMLDETEKQPDTIHNGLPLDDLPSRWQSYTGLVSMLVVNASELAAVQPVQRQAISRWVRWFGGRLWLAGDEALAAAGDLGVDVIRPPAEVLADGRVTVHTHGNGLVYVQPEPDVRILAQSVPIGRLNNPLESYFGFIRFEAPPGEWLLEPLVGTSTNAIIVSLVVLGLLLGPANYLFIRRRKNDLLFFITTPIIAIAGAAAIFGVSFLQEGVGGGFNQMAVLARAADSADAMLFDFRAVRSGFFTNTPEFSADTLAVPVQGLRSRRAIAVEYTDGIRLTGGWLLPRFPTMFLLARPTVSRMNLDLVREGDDYAIVNNLGFTVQQVATRLPDGGVGWTENLPPGAKAVLERDEEESRLLALYYPVRRLNNDNPTFTGVTMVAQCDGLPYIEDGGMNTQLLTGEYYYVVCGGEQGVAP
ncbi:MAG: hypothetical protein LIP77_08700 [Planctomycetes bacterium]|nr:hypothetical protein [Planctomycetota bacterium]